MRRKALVEDLLREMLQGGLRPGTHLVTRALAERFGVSHTPIREALIALSGIGVVNLLPNRGAVVRRFSREEVREICQVRRALECEAVRGACGRINPAELLVLREAFRELFAKTSPFPSNLIENARAADSRLHDLIASSSGNAFLGNEIGRLKILFRAFRDAAWQKEKDRHEYQRIAQEAREHLAIVDALLSSDRRAAVQAMSRHILSGSRYWCRCLPQTPLSSPIEEENPR
jgi:DNA-binding GntR family transcriptional regulator